MATPEQPPSTDIELETRYQLWKDIDLVLRARDTEILKDMLRAKTADLATVDSDNVERGLDFMEEAHRYQTRNLTGDPYIVHTLQVALIGTLLLGPERVTDEHINSLLLHDILEETSIPANVIEGVFKAPTRTAVSGLSHTENGGTKLETPDYFDRIFRINNEQPKLLLPLKKIADIIANANDPVTQEGLRDPAGQFETWNGIVQNKIGEMKDFQQRLGPREVQLQQTLADAIIYTQMSKQPNFSLPALKTQLSQNTITPLRN